jgi:hypothetical protein
MRKLAILVAAGHAVRCCSAARLGPNKAETRVDSGWASPGIIGIISALGTISLTRIIAFAIVTTGAVIAENRRGLYR